MKKLLCLLGMIAGFNAFAEEELPKITILNACFTQDVTGTIDNNPFYLLKFRSSHPIETVTNYIQNGVLISNPDFPTIVIVKINDKIWIDNKCYKKPNLGHINFSVWVNSDFKVNKCVPAIQFTRPDIERCN